MKQWFKRMGRLAFNSIAVHLQEDLHATMKASVAYLNFTARRSQLVDHILHDEKLGITKDKYADHDIIVSLTSFGSRIHEVSLTIESLMQQTMKANRIVLWLDDSFKGEQLPQALIMQQTRGLEVFFYSDIRSYKKLVPQLRQTPKDAIITVDDDILYDFDVLEHLIQAYLSCPRMIHCCRVHKMVVGANGALLPYELWEKRCSKIGQDPLYFITGGAGTLYPPGCFDAEVFNEDVFMDICPDADDVWFTAMAIKKGTPINKVFTRSDKGEDYLESHFMKQGCLSNKNVILGGNDCQIRAVFSKYKLYDMLPGLTLSY